MYIFDTVTFDPEPTDRDLILMYRVYSQEWWCAGWLGDPEQNRDRFVRWLRDDYASFRSESESREWDLQDYELAALPTLRELYAEALGPLQYRKGASVAESQAVTAVEVTVSEDTLTAELSDGRAISVPLAWYPRLTHATPTERGNWQLIGSGEGIHWPDLDEDISVEMLLTGQKSGESRQSFKQWLQAKKEGRGLTLYELRAYEEERQRSTNDQ